MPNPQNSPAPSPLAPIGDTRVTRSTYPYCGVGCGVWIESRGDRIVGVRGDPHHPANSGRLCTKGSTLHWTASPLRQQATRLLQPMLRTQRHTPAEPVGWNRALQPGTDVMLFHGLLHVMDAHGWVDRDCIERHTQGYAELRALVRDSTPEVVAQVCAIPVADLMTAARWLAGVPQDWPAGVPSPEIGASVR